MKGLLRCLRYDWPLHFVLLFTNWLPDNILFLRLRGGMARLFFGSCGPDLRLGRNISFYNPASIHIGSHVFIGLGCWFMAGEQILIGDEVLFGPYCVVSSSNHTRKLGSFRYGKTFLSPVKVGNGSWIASHVVLTAGSNVGDGTLIAAGAVVGDFFPASVLVGGIPGKLIKKIQDDRPK